jgi:hypothetical protein
VQVESSQAAPAFLGATETDHLHRSTHDQRRATRLDALDQCLGEA